MCRVTQERTTKVRLGRQVLHLQERFTPTAHDNIYIILFCFTEKTICTGGRGVKSELKMQAVRENQLSSRGVIFVFPHADFLLRGMDEEVQMGWILPKSAEGEFF